MKGTYQSDNDFLLSAVQRGDQKAFDTLFRSCLLYTSDAADE